MTVHEISNYFNQSPNMENAYKQHKSIGRLIRSNVFKYSSSRHWEDMDLVYKITYIKANRSDLICWSISKSQVLWVVLGVLRRRPVLLSTLRTTTRLLVVVMTIFVGRFETMFKSFSVFLVWIPLRLRLVRLKCVRNFKVSS